MKGIRSVEMIGTDKSRSRALRIEFLRIVFPCFIAKEERITFHMKVHICFVFISSILGGILDPGVYKETLPSWISYLSREEGYRSLVSCYGQTR